MSADGLCDECRDGDHRHHAPHLGGICIGCTCAVHLPPFPEQLTARERETDRQLAESINRVTMTALELKKSHLELIAILRDAMKLMPLGTKKRAAWMERAVSAVMKAEMKP